MSIYNLCYQELIFNGIDSCLNKVQENHKKSQIEARGEVGCELIISELTIIRVEGKDRGRGVCE